MKKNYIKEVGEIHINTFHNPNTQRLSFIHATNSTYPLTYWFPKKWVGS